METSLKINKNQEEKFSLRLAISTVVVLFTITFSGIWAMNSNLGTTELEGWEFFKAFYQFAKIPFWILFVLNLLTCWGGNKKNIKEQIYLELFVLIFCHLCISAMVVISWMFPIETGITFSVFLWELNPFCTTLMIINVVVLMALFFDFLAYLAKK